MCRGIASSRTAADVSSHAFSGAGKAKRLTSRSPRLQTAMANLSPTPMPSSPALLRTDSQPSPPTLRRTARIKGSSTPETILAHSWLDPRRFVLSIAVANVAPIRRCRGSVTSQLGYTATMERDDLTWTFEQESSGRFFFTGKVCPGGCLCPLLVLYQPLCQPRCPCVMARRDRTSAHLLISVMAPRS
jgi:hypothetical protein